MNLDHEEMFAVGVLHVNTLAGIMRGISSPECIDPPDLNKLASLLDAHTKRFNETSAHIVASLRAVAAAKLAAAEGATPPEANVPGVGPVKH